MPPFTWGAIDPCRINLSSGCVCCARGGDVGLLPPADGAAGGHRRRGSARARRISGHSDRAALRASLINTVLLAAATTVATLAIATVAGMFLQRHRFPGRAVLIAMLTFPLAFPGVVVGFLIILLAGRQGLIGDISSRLFGESCLCLFILRPLPRLSLFFDPRVILTIMAAVQKLDVGLEEGSPFARRQPVGGAGAMSCCGSWAAFVASGAIAFATAMARSARRSRWRPISMCCRC